MDSPHPNAYIMPKSDSPESRFNAQYISSAEICKQMKITRAGLTKAITRGTFPPPLKLEFGVHLWQRDEIELKLVEWKEKQVKQFPDRY